MFVKEYLRSLSSLQRHHAFWSRAWPRSPPDRSTVSFVTIRTPIATVERWWNDCTIFPCRREAAYCVQHVLTRQRAAFDIRIMVPSRQCDVRKLKWPTRTATHSVNHLRIDFPSPKPCSLHEASRKQMILLVVALHHIPAPCRHRIVAVSSIGRGSPEHIRERWCRSTLRWINNRPSES